jgi:hypothetical protein
VLHDGAPQKQARTAAGSEPTCGEEGTSPDWGKTTDGSFRLVFRGILAQTHGPRKPLPTQRLLQQEPQLAGVPLCLVAVTVVEEHMHPLGLTGKALHRTVEALQLILRVQVIEPLRRSNSLPIPVRAVSAMQSHDCYLGRGDLPDSGDAARESLRLVDYHVRHAKASTAARRLSPNQGFLRNSIAI